MEVTNLDALAELQSSNVDVQLLRNCRVESLHIQLTNHRDQATTGAYTFSQTLRSDGHTHNDGLLSVNFEEVNVEHVVLYRVELNFLQDTFVVFAVDVDVNEVDVRSIDELVDFLFANREMDGFRLAVGILLFSVENAWNVTAVADGFGSFLAELVRAVPLIEICFIV